MALTTSYLLETFTFRGADGLSLFGRCWPAKVDPSTSPRAAVALVHGISEHSGRYDAVVNHLTESGFVVYAFDLRGHGESPGRRGHIDSWSQYRDDVKAYVEQVRTRDPGLPIFIYGHSLGALIVAEYVLYQPDGLAGVILSGIPLRPVGVAKPPLVLIAKALSRIWPTFSLSLGVRGERLSRDPERVRAYKDDPMIHHTATARWGTETLNAIGRVKSRMHEIKLPILIIHGGSDPVNSVEGGRDLYAAVSSTDKEIKIYPGGMHEPHNDVNRGEAAADVEKWLTRQLENSAKNHSSERAR
jgi:alpha-beta hydrolase superfamily lysophospholipase